MSEITSILLGNGSLVFDECIIDCQELPHGVIDIVGGRIRNKTVDVLIGVLIESMERFALHDPTGISAKTRQTLCTTSLSKYRNVPGKRLWALKHNSQFWPTWALIQDITLICLYRSC